MKTAQRTLRISNTLSGKKEIFTPLHEGLVGMYVCGPTVYNNVHLGNCRTFTSFDIIYRYLLHLGYRVRYVRNITDVGHLTDDGEDRMAQGARLHKLEPMEVAQRYTLDFHEVMRMLNNLPPSIEPRATGHIPEQIEMVQRILERGYAYERNGSVYFNVRKFIAENPGIYGRLSGRVVEELIAESRENLKGQEEKDHPADFALWMKARPGDLMIWKSPWSVGFPGWHLECSVMSTKYLGQTFDIHGGGGDLKFPHHENEITQNYGACGCSPARYWIHTNMLQLNGAKMSKSEGNFITPEQLFTGTSSLLSKAYSPMVLRYYFLQAHYASVLDMTEEGLRAAEKAYNKMMETNQLLQSLPVNTATYDGSESAHDRAILRHIEAAYEGMDDDFNTAIALAHLNELCSYVHKIAHRQIPLDDVSPWVIERLKTFFRAFLFDIFGLRDERQHANGNHLVEGLMALILDIRAAARAQKDWNTSDKIRDALAALGIALKDGKDGTTWTRL